MPYGWFLTPFKRNTDVITRVERYCAIDDYAEQISSDGGEYSTTEILGDMGLVKVRASDQILNMLSGVAGFFRIPDHYLLADSLADLSNQKKNFLNNKLLALGYAQDEIDEASGGDWNIKTLDDLLAFLCTRRLKPRYDEVSDTIILDGEKAPVRSHRDVAFTVK